MNVKRGRVASIFIFLALAVILAGQFNWRDRTPPAADILPVLPQYRSVDGQNVTGYLGSLAGGAALLAGQPELALKIAAVDQAVDCYQEVGAVRGRVYSHGEYPLLAGFVAVADGTLLTDPNTFLACVGADRMGQGPATSGDIAGPCAGYFTVAREDGTFYVIYGGSVDSVCHDLCGGMQGCVLPPDMGPPVK